MNSMAWRRGCPAALRHSLPETRPDARTVCAVYRSGTVVGTRERRRSLPASVARFRPGTGAGGACRDASPGQRQVARALAGAFGTPKEDLEQLALANEKVKVFTDGKQIVKIIVVPDKLVNIVVR